MDRTVVAERPSSRESFSNLMLPIWALINNGKRIEREREILFLNIQPWVSSPGQKLIIKCFKYN